MGPLVRPLNSDVRRLMSTWLQVLRERIWSSRTTAGRSFLPSDDLVMPIALLLIAIAGAPEYFVYIELSTLLDLLGAALFLFAFAMGLWLLLITLVRTMRRAIAPSNLVELVIGPRAISAAVIAFRFRFYWYDV